MSSESIVVNVQCDHSVSVTVNKENNIIISLQSRFGCNNVFSFSSRSLYPYGTEHRLVTVTC